MDTSVPRGAAKLLDFIAAYEAPGGYNVVYGNKQRRMPKQITSMTVDEVIADGPRRTREYGSSACARYQFMTATLKGLKQTQRLTGRELMTPDLQDRLGYALLLGRGYAKFMAGQMSMAAFGNEIAKEWASFPVLAPTNGKRRGQSYYAGDGLNHVLVGPEPVEAVLKAMRAEPVVTVAPAPAVTPLPPSLPRVQDLVVPNESKLSRWLPWLFKKQPAVVAAISRPGLKPRGSEALWDVQKALRDRAYYTKGSLDGLDGPLTQEAVAQARKDNGLGDGGVDAAFMAALPAMPHRPVAAERANMSLGRAAQHAPELFAPAKWLGTFGAGLLGLGGADGAGLLDNVQGTFVRINDTADKVQTGFGYVTSIFAFLVEHKTLVFVALGLFLVMKAAGYVLDAWIKVRAAFF